MFYVFTVGLEEAIKKESRLVCLLIVRSDG